MGQPNASAEEVARTRHPQSYLGPAGATGTIRAIHCATASDGLLAVPCRKLV